MTDAPKIGDPVYIPSESYLSHGEDDFEGGLTRIVLVEESGGGYWIATEFDPADKYNWTFLRERQEQLARAFGQQQPRRKPDYRPEFNQGWDSPEA